MIYSSFIQQGKLHRIHQTVCQDYALAKQEGNFIFIGVADGAGSRPFSHYGAKTALHAAYTYISTRFDTMFTQIETNHPSLKKDFVHFIQQTIKNEIPNMVTDIKNESNIDVELTLNDLHTTLVIYATHQQKAFTLHVGDGMIVGLNKAYQLNVLSEPHNGEFSNQTYFVTMDSAEKYVRIQTINVCDILAVSVMSDGGGDLYVNHQDQQIIPGFYRALIDLVDNKQLFEEKYSHFLKHNMPPHLTDDLSIVFLADEQAIQLNLLKQAHQKMINPENIIKDETTSIFEIEEKQTLIPLITQAHRDRSNALNPKHFSYYTSRGYDKKEAVEKAFSFKGFKHSPNNKVKNIQAIQHVCSSCLSSNIEKVLVNVLDEHQKFIGEYVAKKCLDCQEVTILYKVNKS